MLIGVPKEIKNHEYRVSISPRGVRELNYHGHQVMVQKGAGDGIGFEDIQYQEAGALVIENVEEIFERSDMIVKVKEPQPEECQMLSEGQILFCYLHLAAEPKIAEALINSGCIAIAYETVTDKMGNLPLLAPMSEVAGRVSIQVGAYFLQRGNGGRGVLLSGVPGVEAAEVTIIGGGVVGTNAAIIAGGMGANVTILERSVERVRELEWRLQARNIKSIYATVDAVEEYLVKSDLVVGAVLVPGATAPKIVSAGLIEKMQKGSVVVDVSIDQGGCFETSRPTTHDAPTFVVNGVVHYCVTNMPSAAARTATKSLESATLPYIVDLANNGYRSALKDNPNFRKGMNLCRGRVTNEAVANELNHAYVPPTTFLGGS
ncbi:MAG: alanine dehydrogenase [Rickettsiales bacterium]|nr:alanine dehydrogenase [Pseudomonadota bacterium]MDA0966629.1 alanine dehydrogenase [Pseudomonadota bacterium]MDG4543657.1 alanine dehydrogenase [Rickettsiales bacterium]MDG4545804.1 alanine dehydrogenase [Rickettsiales bacterium]MDG4547422.1 alanine dehydrogenase [Rickettsiales bacterium]